MSVQCERRWIFCVAYNALKTCFSVSINQSINSIATYVTFESEFKWQVDNRWYGKGKHFSVFDGRVARNFAHHIRATH
jgi:hypothetical protein